MPKMRIVSTKQAVQAGEHAPKHVGQFAVKEGKSIPGTSIRAKQVQEKILRTISQ